MNDSPVDCQSMPRCDIQYLIEHFELLNFLLFQSVFALKNNFPILKFLLILLFDYMFYTQKIVIHFAVSFLKIFKIIS